MFVIEKLDTILQNQNVQNRKLDDISNAVNDVKRRGSSHFHDLKDLVQKSFHPLFFYINLKLRKEIVHEITFYYLRQSILLSLFYM